MTEIPRKIKEIANELTELSKTDSNKFVEQYERSIIFDDERFPELIDLHQQLSQTIEGKTDRDLVEIRQYNTSGTDFDKDNREADAETHFYVADVYNQNSPLSPSGGLQPTEQRFKINQTHLRAGDKNGTGRIEWEGKDRAGRVAPISDQTAIAQLETWIRNQYKKLGEKYNKTIDDKQLEQMFKIEFASKIIARIKKFADNLDTNGFSKQADEIRKSIGKDK